RSTQTADGAPAIEFAGEADTARQRHAPVCHRGPAIDVMAETPALASVVTRGAQGQGHAEKGASPGHAGRVSRLSRALSRLREGLKGRRQLAGNVVHDAGLQCDALPFGEINAVFDVNLRNPSPEIAGIAERGQGQRRK